MGMVTLFTAGDKMAGSGWDERDRWPGAAA